MYMEASRSAVGTTVMISGSSTSIRRYVLYVLYVLFVYTSFPHPLSIYLCILFYCSSNFPSYKILTVHPILSIPLLPLQGWRQVYAAGALTSFYTDTFFDEVLTNDPALVPIDNSTSKFAGKHPISAQYYCYCCTTVQYYY